MPANQRESASGRIETARSGRCRSDEVEKSFKAFRRHIRSSYRPSKKTPVTRRSCRVAYQQGAAAVAQVKAAHAADKAQLELLEAAQRDHVTATQAEISAVRDAAAAHAINTKAAAEQKQLDDALAESQKKYADQVATVMNETDGLTDKQNKLADTLGILEAQYKSGAISLEDYAQRAAAAKELIEGIGADKGMDEFTKGLSSDFSELIGKATDFSALIENKDKNKKDTILAQLTQDANEFTASLEKLLLKLLIINPLLNELGLGDQGNGKHCRRCLGTMAASASDRAQRAQIRRSAESQAQLPEAAKAFSGFCRGSSVARLRKALRRTRTRRQACRSIAISSTLLLGAVSAEAWAIRST